MIRFLVKYTERFGGHEEIVRVSMDESMLCNVGTVPDFMIEYMEILSVDHEYPLTLTQRVGRVLEDMSPTGRRLAATLVVGNMFPAFFHAHGPDVIVLDSHHDTDLASVEANVLGALLESVKPYAEPMLIPRRPDNNPRSYKETQRQRRPKRRRR